MPTLIAVLLVVLAIAVFVMFAKLVAGLVILALGAVAAWYLWNRYVKSPGGPGSNTGGSADLSRSGRG